MTMRFLSRILLGLLSLTAVSAIPLNLVSAQDAAPAAAKPFMHKGAERDAERYVQYVLTNWKAGSQKAPELRAAGQKAMTSDARSASRSYALAAAAEPRNAQNWIGLAQALLAIKADPEKGTERYDLPVNASGAAYHAYGLAKDDASKAEALGLVGEAMRRRSYWRPAIEALKASLSLADNGAIRNSYETLRTEHGFRMMDYAAEAELATPRLCVKFSENLARGQIDFAKFVSVDGKDPQSVSAEGQRLCVEGLQHGQRYEVAIRAGLPSDVTENLLKQATVAVYMPDRSATVRFTGKSYVLPSRGQQGIPVVTINTDKVAVEIYRIGDRSLAAELTQGDMDRQLSSYDIEQFKESQGVKVYAGELDVVSKLNAEVTTAVPVNEAVGDLKPGAYAMIAKPAGPQKDNQYNLATQWFIVSDMGLTAFSGDDGVHAFVRSLASTDPIGEANVKLVARNNEVLATVKTDASGYARFDAALARGEGGLEPAILVAENGAGEYAFLDLRANAFDLSDRGVKGRTAPGPLDGYVYTERGVYRPGEEVNFTALVRDAAGVAVPLPVTLIVTRPDGVEHARYALTDQVLGGRAQHLNLSGGAMTGTWRAKLHADPKADPISQVSFLVEDFVPERLDMTVSSTAPALSPEETKTVDIAGRYLYGPPAAGLALEGEIAVKPSGKGVEGYPGYVFGLYDEQVDTTRQSLSDLPQTGDDGKAAITVALPAVPKTARPLEAAITVKLRESGGRTIERAITLPIDMKAARIGIKPGFANASVGEGSKAAFEVILLGADGQPAAESGVVWELSRLDTVWQWYSRDGSWSYDSQTMKRKVTSGTLDLGAGGPTQLALDVDYGRYQLDIVSAKAEGPASSVAFNAGWYADPGKPESPEILDVALDKPSYAPGDTAKLRIASKDGGRTLIAVLGAGLHAMQQVDLPKGGGDVDIKVGDTWGPGAYATAIVYRAMDEKAKRMPSRAIGVKWLGLDQSQRTLTIAMTPEAKIKSGTKLTVPVKVSGLTPGEEARLTVAAVDVGILNLTRFEAPAPEAHFYAQRMLGLEIRDFYGRLIDGMRAERGKLRSGGDGMDSAGLQGSPPVEETVAFFSGLVTVQADGTAQVEFQLPDFNGTVRLMAVAWSKDKLGHATHDVIVRDKLALTASAPRFITLGDETRLDLAVHNVEGPAADYAVSVDRIGDDGAASKTAERTLALKAGERRSEVIALKPGAVGLETYDVSVSGPDGISVKRRLTLDVKVPSNDVKRTVVTALAAKTGKLTLSKDLIAGLIPERTRITLSVGRAAGLDVPGLLSALDRYPYGCAEQTVSRAMPLLYANAVAERLGIASDKEIKDRVQAAVERVFDMQDSSGSFGIWGPSDADLWLTAYVTDFLSRAKESGYAVRPIGFTQALDRLGNFITNAQELKEAGGEDRAYALYVLARNGRAPVGELRYYADTKLDLFATPLSKAQLGAALSMLGDKQRAETVFAAALAQFDDKKAEVPLARDDYGSQLRDGAGLVTLAAETGIAKAEAPRLVTVVSAAYRNRAHTSTQEQAWMLLAAKALGDEQAGLSLAVNGAPVSGSVLRTLTPQELETGVDIANNGDTPVDAVVTVVGAGLKPELPASKGFTIERSYYKLDGSKVDLASANGGTSDVKQNERFVAVLKVTSDEAHGRVLLVDRLPAGFEIENPRIVDSGDVKTLDWLKSSIKAEHSEFRDDRFVAAFDFAVNGARTAHDGGEGESEDNGDPAAAADQAVQSAEEAAKLANAPQATATVAYIVRAVTPGRFVHPAATVEDMYRPERHARTASGTLSVKE
jgi:uncharacterized protein YfaS (alpha-2-macroglobulin family)